MSPAAYEFLLHVSGSLLVAMFGLGIGFGLGRCLWRRPRPEETGERTAG